MPWEVSGGELATWAAQHPGVNADTDDVRLAIACARGDAAALADFDARFTQAIEAAVRRLGDDDFVQDVAQLVRQKLLLRPDASSPPRISEYGGRGSLARFVQAVAVRTALTLKEQRRRQLGVEDSEDALLELPSRSDDPELELVKLHYRAEFKAAFAAALDALEPQVRAAFRQVYGDGLTLAEVGKLYGWSVPTASRRLAAAREALLAGTRAHLAEKLRLDARGVDSVLRVIESRLSIDALAQGQP
ncbi:MAG: sigma-70 family RNA polymerase sigma factor [Myxococcota bacterium]